MSTPSNLARRALVPAVELWRGYTKRLTTSRLLPRNGRTAPTQFTPFHHRIRRLGTLRPWLLDPTMSGIKLLEISKSLFLCFGFSQICALVQRLCVLPICKFLLWPSCKRAPLSGTTKFRRLPSFDCISEARLLALFSSQFPAILLL